MIHELIMELREVGAEVCFGRDKTWVIALSQEPLMEARLILKDNNIPCFNFEEEIGPSYQFEISDTEDN